MALSEILNWIFGTGLVGTIIGLLTLRSELKKAVAEAKKAEAEADTVKITNTEQATRILVQNIVEPLRQELNATREDLNKTKREMARFRKALESIPLCPYHDGCPVLGELQKSSDGNTAADYPTAGVSAETHPGGRGGRQRGFESKASHRSKRKRTNGRDASGDIEEHEPTGQYRLDGEPEREGQQET